MLKNHSGGTLLGSQDEGKSGKKNNSILLRVFLVIQDRITPFKYFHKNLLQALYITDMPTTAAWIDHAFGYYQQVVTVLFMNFRLDLILWEKGFQW